MPDNSACALIAGSGFGDLAKTGVEVPASSAFGQPEGPVRKIEIGPAKVLFLPRHGTEVLTPPHRINYRANMACLKALGAERVVAINTVGSIADDLKPGALVLPDQLLDYTWGREHSIYEGRDHLDHIDFTEPFSASLRAELLAAAETANTSVRDGGVYAVTQGPRLETAAEVRRLTRDGADVVGMTAMPEAALARELDMQYACLSLVVNFAAGIGTDAIHAQLEAGTMTSRNAAMRVLRGFFQAEAE